MSPENPVANWQSLPFEIKTLIFDRFCENLVPKLARYATVDKEWQALVEARTFRSLAVHQLDLRELKDLVKESRRRALRRLWLTVGLPEYTCEDNCHKAELPTKRKANNCSFNTAVRGLFDILSGWEQEDAEATKSTTGSAFGPQSMTLEISAHSRSDRFHTDGYLWWHLQHLPWISLRHNGEAFTGERDLVPYARCVRSLDVARQFDPARTLSHPHGLELLNQTELPEVSFIDKLLILRHSTRLVSVEKALWPIVKSLPQLKSLHYEPWRGHGTKAEHRDLRNNDLLKLVRDVLWDSPNLTSLHIYEDIGRPNRSTWDPAAYPMPPRAELIAANLCRSSRHLQHLCAINMVDAKDFFSPFWPKKEDPNEASRMDWINLEYLTLTSNWLHNQKNWMDLVLAAGRAAKRMPRLKGMEIFAGGDRYEYKFCYERETGTSKLVMASTGAGDELGRSDMGSEARTCWEEVARMHQSRLSSPEAPLEIVMQQYDAHHAHFRNHRSILAEMKGCGNLYSRIFVKDPTRAG